MQSIIKILVLLIFSILSNIIVAQNTWLWAESIDKSNTWNEPFYKPYNTADKLLSFRFDSINYCKDCSLPNLLWKGIEANKITIYQLDKKAKLIPQKSNLVKTKLLTQTTQAGAVESIRDVLTISEIVIYRLPDTIITNLSALPIEWIALKIPFEKDTISLYLKSNECFAYLKSNSCKWVHPLNYHIRLNLSDALLQRNYIIRDFSIVSASNFKALPNYKSSLPPLAQALNKNDTHTSKGKLEVNTDTLLIRLQAMYSADIHTKYNRGFNKVHFVEYLLKLHAENKIKGYSYHEAGYFTPMLAKDLRNHLLVETTEDGDVTVKRFPPTALIRFHTLKTYTQISSNIRITNDWLIFGLGKEVSTTFNNTYAIAFKYEDVLSTLADTKYIWYNGTNERDSIRLDQALQKQYIDYDEMNIYSVYGDTIAWNINTHYDSELSSPDPVLKLLYEYRSPLFVNLSESQTKVLGKANDIAIETYQLNYSFTSANNSVLTKNTALVDVLLDGIRKNKIHVYRDENLTQLTNATSVLNKLDKTRFYKTGNRKKDSIYISKIPLEDRFIKTSELTEFTVSSNYTTIKKQIPCVMFRLMSLSISFKKIKRIKK